MFLTNLDVLTPTLAELTHAMPTNHATHFSPDAAPPRCLKPSVRHTSRKQRLDAAKRLIQQHPEYDRQEMARTICRELNVSMPTAYQYLRDVARSLHASNPTDPNHP